MARSPYGGDKRRREIARKKKREQKLARKHNKDDGPNVSQNAEDTSYLEYLHPGGVPDELLPDSDDDTDESADDSDDD